MVCMGEDSQHIALSVWGRFDSCSLQVALNLLWLVVEVGQVWALACLQRFKKCLKYMFLLKGGVRNLTIKKKKIWMSNEKVVGA